MTEQVREWQKDKDRLERDYDTFLTVRDYNIAPIEIGLHWLHAYAGVRDDAVQLREQAAAEKERGEQLFNTVEQQGKELNRLQEIIRQAEAREKKLVGWINENWEMERTAGTKESIIRTEMWRDFYRKVVSGEIAPDPNNIQTDDLCRGEDRVR